MERDDLDDHTKGFRGSANFQEWKNLLHPFYEPFPTVDQYKDLITEERLTADR